MIHLYRKVLEELLFTDKEQNNLAITTSGGTDGDKGEFSLPPELFPDGITHYKLKGGVEYLENSVEVIGKENPDKIFIIPPLLNRRYLPENIRNEYRRYDLHSLVLKFVLKKLKTSAKLGILLPESFGMTKANESVREDIFQEASLEFFIDHDFDPGTLGFNIHSSFKFLTLIFSLDREKSKPINFFKISNRTYNATDDEILKDLRILKKQGGGETHYGFVLRKNLQPGDRIGYDLLHPKLKKRVEELTDIGNVKHLSDLFEVKQNFNFSQLKDQLTEKPGKNSVAVLDSRCIQKDGQINDEVIQYWIDNPSEELLLQENDICVRSLLTPNSNLVLSFISEDYLDYIAGHHLMILRPIKNLSKDDLRIIIEYLRSDLAKEWIRVNCSGFHLYASLIRNMPIPLIDESFRVAIKSLQEAKEEFEEWSLQGNYGIRSLFEIEYSSDRKFELLKRGRILRQRLRAAKEVDKLSYRIRNLFPYPISYRWRKVEASKPDREGFKNILNCFEVLFVYLSILSMVSSRNTEGIQIKKVSEIAKRLSSGRKSGISLGDWIGLVRECNEKDLSGKKTDWIPFQELFFFLKVNESSEAVNALHKKRNDEAHGRGPSANEIEIFFHEAKEELQLVLKHAEFLSEYKFMHLESTKWDSVENINTYNYRKLMGDHPLVPIETGYSDDNQLEAGSLYVQDRNNKLHLLRPFLTRRNCKVCGRSAIFYLDTYDQKNEICQLKSLELGHVLEDSEISKIYKKVGMLI